MIKSISASIAEGSGFVGVSLPVRIFEPRSTTHVNKSTTMQPEYTIIYLMHLSITRIFVNAKGLAENQQ